MEFRDLKAQYAALAENIDRRMAGVLASARFISGPEVGELEGRLAGYVGRKHCVSCANGTDALELVLRAWDIGPGDAVFLPSFTFAATAEVVALAGARPVFVDIDPVSFNLDAAALEEAIDAAVAARGRPGAAAPRAIVPVDLFGLPADYRAILPLAEKHGLRVLEDAAQGFGGRLDGKPAGGFGDAAATSFFPAKPLGCYGDGGAMFTDDDATAALLRSFCVHGKGTHKYDNVRVGRNSRLDTLQAAVLLAKLDAFEDEVAAVNGHAAFYTGRFERFRPRIETPVVPAGYRSSWAQYTLRCATPELREKLREGLAGRGVPTSVFYPRGLHQQPAYAPADGSAPRLPHTERACETVISLPMHPYLSTSDREAVCAAVEGVMERD